MGDLWLMYWNVHKLKPADPGRRERMVAEIIGKVLTGTLPHLVALTEIGNGDVLNRLADHLNTSHGGKYVANLLHDGDAKIWLDSGLLINDQCVDVDVEPGHAMRGGSGPGSFTRRAVIARCRPAKVKAPPFVLVVNHWWSQGGDREQADNGRRETARWICTTLAKNSDPFAIAVGDFNVEPYDPALCHAAPLLQEDEKWRQEAPLTTRFAEAMADDNRLTPMYNTAWRFLQDPRRPDGSLLREPQPGQSKVGARGSLVYEKAWRVFDQLLVSGQLLKLGPLQLDEATVHYATPQVSFADGRYALEGWDAAEPKLVSDHFPLLAKFAVRGDE